MPLNLNPTCVRGTCRSIGPIPPWVTGLTSNFGSKWICESLPWSHPWWRPLSWECLHRCCHPPDQLGSSFCGWPAALPLNTERPNLIPRAHVIQQRSTIKRNVQNVIKYLTWIRPSITLIILTSSRSTSSDSFMFLVWICKISSLPVESGMPMSISRSKRPATQLLQLNFL